MRTGTAVALGITAAVGALYTIAGRREQELGGGGGGGGKVPIGSGRPPPSDARLAAFERAAGRQSVAVQRKMWAAYVAALLAEGKTPPPEPVFVEPAAAVLMHCRTPGGCPMYPEVANVPPSFMVPLGDALMVVERRGGWLRVRHPGGRLLEGVPVRTGWVNASLLGDGPVYRPEPLPPPLPTPGPTPVPSGNPASLHRCSTGCVLLSPDALDRPTESRPFGVLRDGDRVALLEERDGTAMVPAAGVGGAIGYERRIARWARVRVRNDGREGWIDRSNVLLG